MVVSSTEIVQAYRSLYRTVLRAIRFAKPGRFQARAILRSSFRSLSVEHYNARRILNTIQFLELAGNHAGIEHKILRNLLFVRYWRDRQRHNRLYAAILKEK